MANLSTMVTFLFAGDGSLASDGLAAFLATKSNFILVSECRDGASAIANIESMSPLIAVMDAQLPDMSAEKIIAEARARGSRTKIVVLGATPDRETADRLLAAGADAYVVRNGPSRHLTDAIRYIRDDGKYLAPQLTQQQPVATGAATAPSREDAVSGLKEAVESQGRTVERLEAAMSRAEYAIELLQQKMEQLAGSPIEPPPAPAESAGSRFPRLRAGMGAMAATLVLGVLGFHLAGILRPKPENAAAEFVNAGAQDALAPASTSLLTSPAWESSMVEEAASLLKNQRYDAAENVCRKLLKDDPANRPAMRVLASALFHENKVEEAADVVRAMSVPAVSGSSKQTKAQQLSFDN
jgi:DNA-binding NarL/FixJ family response regulator